MKTVIAAEPGAFEFTTNGEARGDVIAWVIEITDCGGGPYVSCVYVPNDGVPGRSMMLQGLESVRRKPR